MAKTTWDKIDARMTAMHDRNKRMDDTAALLQWDDDPYELVKPDNKTKLKDAISVTPNLPKVFAHGVKSDLLGGKWQTVVEGVSGRRAHSIEEFVEDNLAQADEQLLTEQGIPSLFGWLCNHVCVRWAIGAMWLSWIEDGEYKFKCLPVDMRWTPFVFGKWVAPITFRIKEELEEELEKYERLASEGRGEYNKPSFTNLRVTTTTTTTVTAGSEIEVRDYWDGEKNELWVEKQLVFRQKNPLGYPPFVIVIPASGFMLRDRGYLKHEGEDILFLNAGLYKEFARSVSLEQTSGYAGLYPGYEYEVDNLDASPSVPPPKIDETLKRKQGELHRPVPRGDINRAGVTARADIFDMISAGSPLAPKDYNTPPSAVLLAGETELIARLQNARKEALGVFKTQLARTMIKQFIQIDKAGAELVIGKEGRRRKYSAEKLGNPDEYTITYRLQVKSKRQEMANLAEFAAVYDKLPLEWNLENILMADDPAGIINDLELQKAKSINPALSLLEMALRYAREAANIDDDIEADLKKEQSRILTHEYVVAMRARIQPTPTPAPKIEEPKGNTQLLSALALRGDGGQVRRPEEVV